MERPATADMKIADSRAAAMNLPAAPRASRADDSADDRQSDVLILGAGLAGLGCATALDRAGRAYAILEAESSVGGLARSETHEGYTFDFTGHWLHLRDDSIRELVQSVAGDDLLQIDRSAWVHTRGVFLPYPYQTNTWALPPGLRLECLLRFLQARLGSSMRVRNGDAPGFAEFIRTTFGSGLAAHFLLPYNEKLWTVPLDELSVKGTARFVPEPRLWDVVRGAVTPSGPSGYNVRFLYPRRGGIGALAEALAARLRVPVRLDTRVAAVDVVRRTVTSTSGQKFPFHRLISTLPLPALVGLCHDVPPAVRSAAAKLRAVDVTCVNLGVRREGAPDGTPRHWVYFPDRDVPFYRAGSASDAVPSLAPPGRRSLWVEFSHRGPHETAPLVDAAISGLRRCGLIEPGDVVEVAFARTIPSAYVLFDRDHAGSRQVVLDWLASRGVLSIGRYGRWDYCSMEEALRDGLDAGRGLTEHATAAVTP